MLRIATHSYANRQIVRSVGHLDWPNSVGWLWGLEGPLAATGSGRETTQQLAWHLGQEKGQANSQREAQLAQLGCQGCQLNQVHVGISISRKWMVYKETSYQKWMIYGYPHFWNPPILCFPTFYIFLMEKSHGMPWCWMVLRSWDGYLYQTGVAFPPYHNCVSRLFLRKPSCLENPNQLRDY